MTRRHLRLVHGQEAPLTAAEHELQKRLVELSTRLSARRQERRDETAVLARTYCFPRVNVENVVPIRRDPDPTRPAA